VPAAAATAEVLLRRPRRADSSISIPLRQWDFLHVYVRLVSRYRWQNFSDATAALHARYRLSWRYLDVLQHGRLVLCLLRLYSDIVVEVVEASFYQVTPGTLALVNMY